MKIRPVSIDCPKGCGAEYQQVYHVSAVGGHKTNWTRRTEWSWARARVYLKCNICGAKHVHIKNWRG